MDGNGKGRLAIEPRSFEREVGGSTLRFETGELAKQASGSVTVSYGDTTVLVTACVGREPRAGIDFLPLVIDYEERLYAAGKIPGSFIRREGRPSEEAILASRLTDRSLRPLVPKTWRHDIQIVVTVLSVDLENDPDILAIIGGSAALSISPVPFHGPLSAVRVGYINGELVLNPTLVQMEESLLDLVVASTQEGMVMVEAGAKEVSEDVVSRALEFGHRANHDIIKLQQQIIQSIGQPKMEAPVSEIDSTVLSAVSTLVNDRLGQALYQAGKQEREEALDNLKEEVVESLREVFAVEDILFAFEVTVRAEIRSLILEKRQRVDGRGLDQIRPISSRVGVLPRVHGSALFNRGETQVLTITTLGSTRREQLLDGLGIEETKRFIHHYNFPPFSNGEVRRIGTPGRREVGHGALVERAMRPVVPTDGDYPYTIRLVSEVLGSSGSTSMASVCASSLSLMDAGVPVRAAVAGVAMGLITGEDSYAVLTDIGNLEDAYGDMDFKVAGTVRGITALQMDIKLKSVNLEIMGKALEQAHSASLYTLEKMGQTISASRPEVSRHAPRMHRMKINLDKIGAVIGSGGKTIRSIIDVTKTTIDIEDDGTILIGSPDEASAQRAISLIESLTREPKVGDVYTGKITRIMPFGAFAEIMPGKEGLIHISEMADHRIRKVEDVVKTGDEIMVKIIEIDNMGRINLSHKAVLENVTG